MNSEEQWIQSEIDRIKRKRKNAYGQPAEFCSFCGQKLKWPADIRKLLSN